MYSVGIFDTGVGGKSFAHQLQKAHPGLEMTVVQDLDNLPYGSKSPTEIKKYTDEAIQPLLGMDIIVIACNTATAYAIEYLREAYPLQKFVGFEPALKVAASLTKTGCIGVLATPATLKSQRYKLLKTKFTNQLRVTEPDVSHLAQQIEVNEVDWEYLKKVISDLKLKDADVITLGCTHYHLIKDGLQELANPEITVITPTKAVIRRIENLLSL